MTTTGYADTFGRTVSSGLGTATSGQVYTLFGVAAQFNVAPNFATIAPSSSGDKIGYVDNQTSDVDITLQVSMNAIPASALATAGVVAKLGTISNYYNATMMVATGGAISLRFSKVVGGGLSTIATVATGLTYVANTVYNLRASIRWSQALQTNVLQSKLWLTTATEPTGWMATATDSSVTNYVAGTNVGIMGRDEQASPSVTVKIQNVATRTYNLPVPATTDPMCYDPAFVYPKQTALESLADATDAVVATLDPLASLAALFPRVRVSVTGLANNNTFFTYNATEYNVGTPTNLSYDNRNLYLGVGVWVVLFEAQFVQAASDTLWVTLFSSGSLNGISPAAAARSNPAHTGDQGVGGSVHVGATFYSTDPTTPIKVSANLTTPSTTNSYTATYAALSAIKISDYFA
jgi:hypothetical protein